jgi:hypothetical protein
MYIASLITIASSMQCASSGTAPIDLIPFQPTWTQNQELARVIEYNIGSDGYALCAYDEISTEHPVHPWRTDEALNFGFAIVPRVELQEKLCISKDTFMKLAPNNTYFHIQEDGDLTTRNLATTVAAYTYANPNKPRRFLFICSNLDAQYDIGKTLDSSADLATLAAATAYLHSQLPFTTYVLLDAIEYCNNLVKPKPTKTE